MSNNDWTAHLEFEEGNSSKFWRARVEGKSLYVNYGKIGSAGQTQVKEFGTPDLATKEYDKLVREKLKKGYQEPGGGGSSSNDADGDDDDGDEDGDDQAPPRKPAAAAKPAGQRMVLEAGNRKVEVYLSVDGKTVRMDSVETYATPEAAKKAHERLKKTLAGEGYRD